MASDDVIRSRAASKQAQRLDARALDEVQVESPSGDTPAGFELTFNLPKRSPLETIFLLTGGSSIPILRVVIVVTVGGTASVLMDGVMTHHEVRTGAAGSCSGRGPRSVRGWCPPTAITGANAAAEHAPTRWLPRCG